MTWLLGFIVDNVPWWVWLVALAVLLAITWQAWRPIWALLPSPIKAAVLIIGTAVLAYLAGRNKGASGALHRAQERETARAEDIRDRGAKARERADRDALGDRLRDDDGWKRHDG